MARGHMATELATELEVRAVATTDPGAATLLSSYADEIDELLERAPARVETIASEYEPPRGAFLVVYEGDRAVACGGVRPLDDGAAEVKRMYVVPEARGRGLGARLLQRLEDEARRLGYRRLRLDTGAALTAAQGLYRGAGYHE